MLGRLFQVPLQGVTACPEPQHLLSMANSNCSRDAGPPSWASYSCPGPLGSGRAAGATHCPLHILFGSSFLSLLAWSEPCLPPQLLAFSVHTITGCDPFEERKWGGRQC